MFSFALLPVLSTGFCRRKLQPFRYRFNTVVAFGLLKTSFLPQFLCQAFLCKNKRLPCCAADHFASTAFFCKICLFIVKREISLQNKCLDFQSFKKAAILGNSCRQFLRICSSMAEKSVPYTSASFCTTKRTLKGLLTVPLKGTGVM